MNRRASLFILVLLGFAIVLIACGESATPPQAKIETTNELLVRICGLASDCVPPDGEELIGCPAELLTKLDDEDKAELDRFTTFDKEKQDRILTCFDAAICDRFGGSLLNMSDSDLMETLRDCE